MTIPKTYTLRQLKKLGEKWLFVDLFLNFLEEREGEEERPEMVGAISDDFKAAVKKKGMKKSRLDYPINVLESERDDVHCPLKSQVDQLQEAIDILTREKYKRVKEEFKKAVVKRTDALGFK